MLTRSIKYKKDREGPKPLIKQKTLPGGISKSDEVVVKDIQFAYNNHAVI